MIVKRFFHRVAARVAGRACPRQTLAPARYSLRAMTSDAFDAPPMRTLAASGLTLVPQTAEHADAMFALLADAEVYAYLEGDPPTSPEVLRVYFTRLESRRSGDGTEQWLNWVVRLDNGDIAGHLQATVCAGGVAWVAYVLGRAYWGRGIAERATRAMLDELATAYGVTHFLATADRDNRRSLGLLERLGFALAPAHVRGEHDVAEHDVSMQFRLDDRR